MPVQIGYAHMLIFDDVWHIQPALMTVSSLLCRRLCSDNKTHAGQPQSRTSVAMHAIRTPVYVGYDLCGIPCYNRLCYHTL